MKRAFQTDIPEARILKNTLKRLAILGSTGSIGQSTLSIVEQFPERYSVAALAAGRNLDIAFAQTVRWRPKLVSLATEGLAGHLRARLREAGVTGVEVVYGTEGTVTCSTLPDADFVVSAIVGVAGLEATHAAILAGKPIGWPTRNAWCRRRNPYPRRARAQRAHPAIDSEHNAVHQCLRVGDHAEVKTIWLTASGRPFPAASAGKICRHYPGTGAQASHLGHGPANHHRLGVHVEQRIGDHRGLPPLRCAPVAGSGHGASAVHGALSRGVCRRLHLAQISVTDMRLPILYALAYPERPASTLTFDMTALKHLEFEPPDFERFPCLRLAYDAAEKGGAHCIALNAADEVAVEAFLERRIPFTGIPRTIEMVLGTTPEAHPDTIAQVLAADREARETARAMIARIAFQPVALPA